MLQTNIPSKVRYIKSHKICSFFVRVLFIIIILLLLLFIKFAHTYTYTLLKSRLIKIRARDLLETIKGF